MGKDGSVSVREGIVMSQDAPVNTGASWPELLSAEFAVVRMQAKLHLWAAPVPRRRFGDLFLNSLSMTLVSWVVVLGKKSRGLRNRAPASGLFDKAATAGQFGTLGWGRGVSGADPGFAEVG